jgi:ATP-dependent RNA helicase DDX58
MMMTVIEYIDSLPEVVYSQRIKQIQWSSKTEREMVTHAKNIREALKKAREHKDEYELRCIKCEAFGVWSQDLRTIKQTHHVLIGDEGFEKRITLVPHPRPKKYDNWEKKAKIICKECSQEWGIKALCDNIPYCVLAVCNFVIVDPNGDRKVVKKWKDVIFPVPELSLEDMRNMNQSL